MYPQQREGGFALKFQDGCCRTNSARAQLNKNDTAAVEACSLAFVLSRKLERDVGCRVHVLNSGKRAVI